ncbi:MAG: hypothetical protein KKB90_01260 [Actinobacteria bacterium]|nr:hypothetical protein [Actinomycetota bacterium]MCG2817721.1 hypothetical protein [Actinomycetes bacterium]MBU4217576.1 hypothetical protein [Actinomycetota bacterium]MBU4358097.1 hypothetical protein [Actinomycetota bacterium]MBU4391780.1 hypothetical protein [Actinomycetota bacterium]
MPLDKLIERILGDARREARSISDEAASQAEEIGAEAEREAQRTYEKGVESARHAAEDEKRQRVTMSSLEARKAVLAEKQVLIEEVAGRALEKIADLPEEQYAEMMVRRLLDVVGEQDGELIMSPADRDRVGPDIVSRVNSALERSSKKGRVTLSSKTRDIAGGFIFRSGGVEVNSSLESEVGSRKEELESKIVEILFGEPE